MAYPGRSLVLLSLVLLAVALLFIVLAPSGADAQIATIVVDLEDADKVQTAFPTETANDILVFEGCLTLNRPIWPPGTSVVITIEIDFSGVDEDWEFSMDPPTHTFAASESQAFEARVTVPAGLPATVDLGPVLEFAASTPDILVYDDTPDQARVTIAQYYKITRFYSTEPIKITQGEITEFNLTVSNQGNGVDSLSFVITNEAELLFAGLTLTVPSPKRIQPGDEANVNFQMQADEDAVVGQFRINITIKSEGSSTDPNYEQPVTSGADWNVVIEESITTRFLDNIVFIVIGVIVVVVVIVVYVMLRRRKLAREREEAEAEEMERARRSKKKRKRPPKVEPDEDEADEDDAEE